MHAIEPFFAFYDPDFALMTMLRRQPWPATHQEFLRRSGFRKLSLQEVDRNTHMWSKVENHPDYQKMAQDVWAQDFDMPTYKTMELSAQKRWVAHYR